jgi:hypothetical protein
MPNTYTITSQTNTYVAGPVDPLITITGIINGGVFTGQYANTPWIVQVWTSAYNAVIAQGNNATIAFFGPLIVAAAQQNVPPVPLQPVNSVTGTFPFTQ